MSKEAKSDTPATAPAKAKQSTSFQSAVQAKIDAENAKGFRGTEVDSTPNENYTVSGVTSGAPTPETHIEAAKKVRDESGLGLSALESAARDKESVAANAATTRKAKRGK